MNSVVLIGRLTRDPELKYTSSQRAYCQFTLAVDKGLSKDKKMEFENSGRNTADFIRIIVWGPQAENCSRFLKKGRQCAINGSITTGSYKDSDGKTVYTTDVTANRVEFLEWGDRNDFSNSNNQNQNSYQRSDSNSGNNCSNDYNNSPNSFNSGNFDDFGDSNDDFEPFDSDESIPF